MGSGTPPRKELTVNLGLLPRHLSRLFSPGVASPSMASLGIKPGRFPCMQQVPPWNPWLVSTSSSIEPSPTHRLDFCSSYPFNVGLPKSEYRDPYCAVVSLGSRSVKFNISPE